MKETRFYIRLLREAAGLEQSALAKRLGVNRATVCKWERGTTQPESRRLPQLADALCCSIDALYGRDGLSG